MNLIQFELQNKKCYGRRRWLLVSYGLLVFEEIIRRSGFFEFPAVRYSCYFILLITCGFSGLKVILDVYQKKFTACELVVLFVTTVYTLFIFYRGQTDAYMLYLLFIAASHDLDFRLLVKTLVFATLTALFIVIICSYAGIIQNRIDLRVRNNIAFNRNMLGFAAPYHASYFSLFLCLSWVYIRRERISFYELVSLMILACFVFWQTDTRGPFLLSILTLFIAVLLKIVPQLQSYYKIYTCFALLAPFVCVSLILIQARWGNPGHSEILQTINGLMSSRLQYNYDSFHRYGIDFFGRDINWNVIWTEFNEYNWVDSVYLYTLQSYGVPFLIGYLLLCVFLTVKAEKFKDVYMVIVLIILAVLGIFDNYCFRIECNPFYLFLSYSAMGSCKGDYRT